MTGFIPREKLTAYQRWELAAFDEEEPALDAVAESPEKAEAPAQTGEAPTQTEVSEPFAVVLPTAAEIERMHDEAREQGHAEGYAEGQKAGHAEGHAAGYAEGQGEAREIAARIAEILDNLAQAIDGIEQSVADRLLDTAVEIANQVLRQSLRIKPEILLPVVREAVEALQFSSGNPALLAHPDDAVLIRERMGDHLAHNNWRIIEDPSLTRGGCRVDLGASEVDATVETRWKRVIETIGRRGDWLDEEGSDRRHER
ncbi:MAG: flagellar assembly protein FliH [Candidatus Accumulibacter sp.]|jgi:flagellar assembly protein FliH|nr:flagellar assembly protein FliH [Accumulibacter sp.]